MTIVTPIMEALIVQAAAKWPSLWGVKKAVAKTTPASAAQSKTWTAPTIVEVKRCKMTAVAVNKPTETATVIASALLNPMVVVPVTITRIMTVAVVQQTSPVMATKSVLTIPMMIATH